LTDLEIDWTQGVAENFERVLSALETANKRADEAEAKLNLWRPIEEAPKDGSWILLGYFPEVGGESQTVAFWHSTKNMWCDSNRLLVADGPFSPTHFRPLPPAPEVLKWQPR